MMSGTWAKVPIMEVATRNQMYAIPAALVAYLDPLSGIVPMSQAVGAGLTAGGAMKLFDKDTKVDNAAVMEAGMTLAGTYVGGMFFGNYMDSRSAAALGAWLSGTFGLYLILGTFGL